MTCYRLKDGVFEQAEDPISNDGENNYIGALMKAGYLKQLSSLAHESEHSEITLYARSDTQKPKYYIDVTGYLGQMAVLIADDFPALISTLKEIAPLIALIGLDQQVDIQAERIGRASHPGLR